MPTTSERKARGPVRRSPITAEFLPRADGVPVRPILLRTGRGDSRLDPAEAMRLIADLQAAVLAAAAEVHR